MAFGGNVQWEDLKLFEREANVLKQLNHPRIPKYRDYFSIDEAIIFPNNKIIIYNRWGEVVFESRNALVGWDGTYGPDALQAPTGMYTYRILYKNPDLDERKVLTGHVNLLR